MKGLLASFVVLGVLLAGAAGYAYRHWTHRGGAAVAHGRPVFAMPPDQAPATEIVHRRICSNVQPAAADTSVSHGLVWVHPNPAGGVAVWRPGMNSTSCKAALTHLSERQAQAFAETVDRSKAVPPGNYSCPEEDASGLTVYLTYPHRARAEVVQVDLEGCRWISAPGRAARMSDGAVGVLGKKPAGLH